MGDKQIGSKWTQGIGRRTFLKSAAVVTAATTLGKIPAMVSAAQAPALRKGVTLRVMAYAFPVTAMIRDSRAEYEK